MKQLRFRLLLIAVAFCGLAGCTRRNQPSPSPSPATAQPSASATAPAQTEGERPRPASIRSPAQTGQAKAVPAAAAPPPATPTTSAELLETDREPPVAARDFRIGPLDVPAAGGRSEPSQVLARFLDAMTRGEIAGDLLDPESRDRITRSLTYFVDKGALPVRYRVGELRDAGESEMLANVRLFGSRGVAEGEVYLVHAESGWLVGDLQIGLALLAEPYEPPQEAFVPSSYEYSPPPADDGG